MEISYRDKGISELKKDRVEAFSIPDSWCPKNNYFERGYDYTISQKVEGILGSTTFGNKIVSISLLPYDDTKKENISFCLKGRKSREAIVENVLLGQNNIQIGDIGICEHVLSLGPSLGLKVNYFLTENNFPSFDSGLDTILNEIKPFLIKIGESKYFTVKKPILFTFDNGGYFILEPNEGEKKLIVDHQFSYRNKSLGSQRFTAEITPELFSFIAKARPISSGVRTQVAQICFGFGISHIPLLGFTKKNALYVNDNEIINPNKTFNDNNGVNREGITHEVIDKLGAIGLLGGKRFVGKIITFRTSHENDVDVMRYIVNNKLLEDN